MKLLGVCGKTELANAKQSIITMMEVYAVRRCAYAGATRCMAARAVELDL